jgi:hypothetical protein
MNICKIPLTSPMILDFGCAADRMIHLAVPKDFEIVKTHMVIKGDNFDGDVFSKTFGTTASAKTTGSDGYEEIDPDEAIPVDVTSIIIDFHTLRTITGLGLQEYTPAEDDLFCIVRVGSGGSWYLPTPKNLLELGYDSSTLSSIPISAGLPEITAEKMLLTFAKLKLSDGSGYVTHGTTSGNMYELEDIIIEEKSLTPVGLSIFTSDFLTNFSIQVGDASPFFQPENEFFTDDAGYPLPDFSGQINQYMEDADPLSFEDVEILDVHPGFAYLEDLPFYLVPLTLHTERSGVLEITRLDLEYVRHHRAFKLEDADQYPVFTEEAKPLTFEWDPRRSGTIIRDVPVNLENPGEIKFISMKLEGGFSAERIIPSADIQPSISPGANSPLGFQVLANKMAAQKIELFKPFRIKGIDLPVKFIDKEVTYTVEIRNDANNRPGEKILVSKKMKVEAQAADENTPSLAKDFLWTPVDFQEEIELTKGTYWLVLEGIAGELVWQIAGQTGAGLTNFLYAYKDENSKWTPLAHSYEKEVCAVYRLRHIPLQFDNPPVLQIKLNNENVWKLARDFESIDILVEEEVSISINDVPGDSPYVSLAFEAQSVGTLKISDLLVKYREVPGKRVQINGFVDSVLSAR